MSRPDSGFALIVVIWLTGLLAIFVLSFSQSARVHVGTASNMRDRYAADALAAAGIELAAMRLLATSQQDGLAPPLFDGTPTHCRLPDGSRLELSIRDTAGRVDLNIASEATLRALFRGIGLEPGLASRLAAAVLDFRDADDQAHPDGAEASDYRAAGLTWAPRNGPFRSIEEIGSVLGAPPGLLEKLRPFLTIRSGQRGVDQRVAEPELVALLRRGYDGDVLSAAAEAGLASNERQLLPPSLSAASARQAFVARSIVTTKRGAKYVREAVLGLARPLRTERRTQDAAASQAALRSSGGRSATRPLGVVIWDWRTGIATTDGPPPEPLQRC
ncbi:MAG: general secretion pathway protein GspK [Alphaproteobacteria bacterium]|nr:general secretion pathway protein GspK [Alphaproteobacteria bacterium]